jgi:hypothetical protein
MAQRTENNVTPTELAEQFNLPRHVMVARLRKYALLPQRRYPYQRLKLDPKQLPRLRALLERDGYLPPSAA